MFLPLTIFSVATPTLHAHTHLIRYAITAVSKIKLTDPITAEAVTALLQLYSGSPRSSLAMDEIVSHACSEAEVYRRCGVHGVIVENMHDVPYVRGGVGPEVTAAMTRIAAEVRKVAGDMILGVQVLSCE